MIYHGKIESWTQYCELNKVVNRSVPMWQYYTTALKKAETNAARLLNLRIVPPLRCDPACTVITDNIFRNRIKLNIVDSETVVSLSCLLHAVTSRLNISRDARQTRIIIHLPCVVRRESVLQNVQALVQTQCPWSEAFLEEDFVYTASVSLRLD